MKSVSELLLEASELFSKRNTEYKDAYKRIGAIYMLLFPDGIVLKTERDFNRFTCFNQIVGKVFRYAVKFDDMDNPDHTNDISVYAMMLQELDNE